MRKRLTCILLMAVLLVSLMLNSCGVVSANMTEFSFLLNLNDLVIDDYGILPDKEDINSDTSRVRLDDDHIVLTMQVDAATGYLEQCELALYFDTEPETVDYQMFVYFFYMILKAHDEDMSVANVNTIHDSLQIEQYDSGISTQIGYGGNTYFYDVTDECAIFAAQYVVATAEADD